MLQEDVMSAPGKDLWTLNTLTTLLATGDTTGGAMGACAWWGTPAGNVPLHVHAGEDEAFFVLEGDLTFYIGEERRTVGSGDFVFAPRNIPHQFTVDSEEARMLVVVTPGGFESFFEDVGKPATSRTLPPAEEGDPEHVARIAAGYGVEILGPPLA